MAITRKQIIESIHEGLCSARGEYENTIVNRIAERLRNRQSRGESIRYTKPGLTELRFGRIREMSGARLPRPLCEYRDNYECPDITLLNNQERPICVIEVKRYLE